MKFRYVLVVMLAVFLFNSIHMFVGSVNINKGLKKKYDETIKIVEQNKVDKEIYVKKEQELQELKEKNKDKISRYEEVVKWNEEVKQYLD